MPAAPLTRYDRAFFLTSKHVPENLRARLRETVEAIAADWPRLPGPDDRETKLSPSPAVWHRRRVGASSWWLHYTVTGEGVLIRSVNDLG